MVQRKFDLMHDFAGSCSMYLRDSLSTRSTTIIPIVMNDDDRGDPSAKFAHPEHASFAEQAYPNCFPDSEIRNMKIDLYVFHSKSLGTQTEKIKYEYAIISCAFPEDLDALDEASGLSMKEVLELQKETTDRQAFPLWSGIDMLDGQLQHALVPGLTGGQTIEGVNFSSPILKDQLKYGRIRGLLRKCMPIGYRTGIIRGQTNTGRWKKMSFNFTPSSAKFVNPYTFFGILIKVPQTEQISGMNVQEDQIIDEANITLDTEKLTFAWHVTYNERNPEFDMSKV